jgi:hypothetical protein
MPIDPSIPLQVQNLKIDSGANQLAMMESAAKLGELNRLNEDRNALRGLDPNAPDYLNKVTQINPKLGMEIGAHQATIKKQAAETTGIEHTNRQNQFADLSFNPSNENITAHLQDSILKGQLQPDQAQGLLNKVLPMNPQQRQQFFTDMGMKANERATLTEQRQHNRTTEGIAGGHLAVAQQGLSQGAIPAGYRMNANKELEQIPGGPTTVALAPKDLQAREAKYPQATSSVKTFDSSADELVRDLTALKNSPGLSSITGVAAGRMPGLTSEGRAAEALYKKIQARGGFSELQNLRNSSPTGGALGNVSNQEGQQLKSAFAAIDRTQDAPDVIRAINDAIVKVQGGKQRIRDAYDMTYEYKGGGTPSSTAPKGAADPLGIR